MFGTNNIIRSVMMISDVCIMSWQPLQDHERENSKPTATSGELTAYCSDNTLLTLSLSVWCINDYSIIAVIIIYQLAKICNFQSFVWKIDNRSRTNELGLSVNNCFVKFCTSAFESKLVCIYDRIAFFVKNCVKC